MIVINGELSNDIHYRFLGLDLGFHKGGWKGAFHAGP